MVEYDLIVLLKYLSKKDEMSLSIKYNLA